jgi:hypothetical protein
MWHKIFISLMQTFTYLMDLTQSALFFYFSYQFLILHLLIFVCTQFHYHNIKYRPH